MLRSNISSNSLSRLENYKIWNHKITEYMLITFVKVLMTISLEKESRDP